MINDFNIWGNATLFIVKTPVLTIDKLGRAYAA
jgi:hypothetical protein